MSTVAGGDPVLDTDNGAPETWVPTFTDITLGTGSTVIARYERPGKGKWIYWRLTVVLGTGGVFGALPRFTLPVAANGGAGTYLGARDPVGRGDIRDASVGDSSLRPALCYLSGSQSTAQLFYQTAGPAWATVNATTPWTWAVGDHFTLHGMYETD